MKKDFILGVVFFGSLWGISEVLLGGFLYRNHVSHASVPLTIIGFIVLTIAKIYFPQRTSATSIGSIAMLYKFLNTPFFACHLLAIFLLGLSYDLVHRMFKIKSKALFGLIATYLGYMLFALTITYIFQYYYWTEEGLPRILRYVGVSGTLAAFANFIAVPLSFNVGHILKQKTINPFAFTSPLATGSVSLITLAIWFLGVARWI